MPELDAQSQENFIDQLEQSAASSGSYSEAKSIDIFDGIVDARLTQACRRRPWGMRWMIARHQAQLRKHERRLLSTAFSSRCALEEQIEQVESLRFAVHYGQCGNAQQRAWCLLQIARYRIAPLDAPLLVWGSVINIRRQQIVFGHWDWVFGMLSMCPVLLLFFYAVCIALSPIASVALKVAFTTADLAAGWVAFNFYKSINFDAFWVGLRYFRPNGLRTTPLAR